MHKKLFLMLKIANDRTYLTYKVDTNAYTSLIGKIYALKNVCFQ